MVTGTGTRTTGVTTIENVEETLIFKTCEGSLIRCHLPDLAEILIQDFMHVLITSNKNIQSKMLTLERPQKYTLIFRRSMAVNSEVSGGI